MRMLTVVRGTMFGAMVLGTVALILSGCPAFEKPSATPTKQHAGPASTGAPSEPASKPKEWPEAKADESRAAGKTKPREEVVTEEIKQIEEKPRNLGQPLVDDAKDLTRLDPEQPVWIDPKRKEVVVMGEACKAGYPLEFFATFSNRAYEAVVAVNVKPEIIHAGLVGAGAKAGHPVQFQPQFSPATGTEVAIEVRWKDDKGKVQSAPAQHWIRDIKTKKELDKKWVFGGSVFTKDEETGKEYYMANGGDMISVLNLPSAMLDLPVRSVGAIESRSYEAFAEHLPPPGTPVTIILKPVLTKTDKGQGENKAAAPANPDAEKAAVEAADAWLALVDQGEYARGWDSASSYLKDRRDRRDFIQDLNGARKPLGKVKSREVLAKRYMTSLPGAPDGQYVVIQYKTSFEKKESAIETVTPMLDSDKKWKVSGYYIK